ncbi:MAG: GGDEF domain-containing protein [Gammaproteobacteria bacterium]|nr:MAG: GGDEF domain-containing protein [Gammaproteobacteria bacterium]
MLKARLTGAGKKEKTWLDDFLVPAQPFMLLILATVFSLLWSGLAISNSLASSIGQETGIAQASFYLEDSGAPLNLSEANALYQSGAFADTKLPLSLGIGSRPVWVRFDFSHVKKAALSKRLSVHTSWLDKLDVYFLHDGQLARTYHVGDSLAYSQRPRPSRYFTFDHDFSPGISTVLIRVETPDPMLLPIYLQDIKRAGAAETFENYSYGFVYGGMFALLAYNLMIFFSLRNSRYLYYSLYISAFLAVNIAYTGHGFMWFWSDYPHWQAWSNPVLMMCFSLAGLLFATHFLDTKEALPKLHRVVVLIGAGFLCAELIAIGVGSRVSALLLSFSLVFVFSGLMVLLGAVAFVKGNQSAKYFLIGSITHVTASSITAMAVWGLMPYSTLAYRAVEFGMMADAILLAMALADKFRIVQEEKLLAEILSKLDPLTSINNRRAFYELVNPAWDVGLRKGRSMSAILLDVDRFKGINDRFGHAQGDEILVRIADVLSTEIRSGDILARWGGEEFVIFLPETPCDTALAIAERLREKVAVMPLPDPLQRLVLTVSLGVAENDQGNKSLDELISAADKYLYQAKDAGRNQVCSGLLSEVSLNNSLNAAVA